MQSDFLEPPLVRQIFTGEVKTVKTAIPHPPHRSTTVTHTHIYCGKWCIVLLMPTMLK